MDKGSENANKQVAVAPVVRRKEKSGNKGKREAAEALEKTISAKKQKKVEAEVKKVHAPPPKEEESTSTEEDTYSESEEEETISAKKTIREAAEALEKTISAKKQKKVEAEVKKVQAPPPKEEESTSTEEDTYSESEEEEKVEAEVKKVQAPPPKEEEHTSTEEDTYSESEEEEVEAEVKKVQAPPHKEEEYSSTEEDTYSESEEEEVSIQPKTPIGNQSERGVTRIFVGNLPSRVDEDDIAALFKEAGEVIEVRLARWKLLKDNNSKGFCHVEFATEEAAKRALEMNQQEFMGCELRVQLAKPEKRRKDNSSIHKGEDEPKTRVGNQNEHGMATIFVANLPFTANEDEIAAFFKEAGEVIEVRLSRGYCHVEFATEEAAKRALEMKHEFMGRELILDMGTRKVSSTHSSDQGNSREHGGSRGRGGYRGRGGDRGCGGYRGRSGYRGRGDYRGRGGYRGRSGDRGRGGGRGRGGRGRGRGGGGRGGTRY